MLYLSIRERHRVETKLIIFFMFWTCCTAKSCHGGVGPILNVAMWPHYLLLHLCMGAYCSEMPVLVNLLQFEKDGRIFRDLGKNCHGVSSRICNLLHLFDKNPIIFSSSHVSLFQLYVSFYSFHPSIMTILTSESGASEDVTVRRTESIDVHGISKLKAVFTQRVFGNVNVIYLL